MINALKKIGIVSVTVVLSIFFFLPTTASAQGLPPLIPACATDSGASAGNCTGCHFLAFFGNLTEIILSYTSVVVLLMIVIGGLVWITSAGKPDRVQRGQQIIIGAIIGAALVFFSYIIVNTFIVAFLAPEK